MSGDAAVAAAAREFADLQGRRAAAYSELHVMLRRQVSAVDDIEARALMHEGQEEAARIQLEFQEVSKSVRGLEARLLESAEEKQVALAKALRTIQNLERRKLELTQAVYKTRATLKNFEGYNRREKDPWEAEEEYRASDMEGAPSPMDYHASQLDAARQALNALVEDINDHIDVVEGIRERAEAMIVEDVDETRRA
eukprot:TRINITY_DN612_c3_g1_i1.p1 TRINITY_DN612_c3_g1~~TRINITY_DN612_c3_g1_i1.p1  ORF type:complete len:216 (+),score=100.31 TRINITY_DN612_c3_g1_i1:58-648(+)